MIIIIISISLLMIIGGIIYYYIDYDTGDIVIPILEIVGVLILIGSLIALILLIDNVKQLDIIDKKIQMYQEENNKIESDIDLLVKQYIEYEKDTFKNTKNENAMTLVSLYPELKSNELVQEQIKVYTNNNYQIKKLKEEKLDYQVSKWWLYFGKAE